MSFQTLEFIVRSSGLTLRWEAIRGFRLEKWSALHFKRLNLTAVMRKDCRKARMQAERPIRRLLQ